MQKKIILLLSLALAAIALARRAKRPWPAWFQQLQGWQKLFGVIAVILVIVIFLNPDLIALSLLGDTAFFDILVLALSIQMFTYAQCAWHWLRDGVVRSARWLGIPSPGARYLICVSAVTIMSVISFAQKIIHRISS